MARGHHHRPEEHPHHNHPMHERARGGKIPEEHEGKMHDYTANSEVVKEAEGEERKHGGRGRKRALGGAAVVARKRGGAVHHGKHHVSHHGDGVVVHHHHKDGGAPKKHVEGEGHKTKHRRLDRPGRKRGGGVGADMTPLSSAARAHQAGAHKADADELAE